MPRVNKTTVFIDNSNIFHGCKTAGWRIDPKKLMDLIRKRGDVWQTIFFASATDPPRFKQTNFYKRLKEKLHFETVILGVSPRQVRCSGCGAIRKTYAEKGVDVALATRMLSQANTRTFDTAVLVSGDKDYLETVREVKRLGIRVEVYSWRNSLSPDLAGESSDDVVYLDDHKSDLEFPVPGDMEVEELLDTEREQ